MTDWIAVAHQVAGELSADAAERDRANQPPVAEVELLRASGLFAADESVTYTVTRIIAAADTSIGHLLGYHYQHLWRAELFDNPEPAARMRDDSSWFWSGVSNPLDAALQLTPVTGGFTVNGHKTFATGASVADRLVVSATRTGTDEKVTFTLDAKAPGISFPGGWDNIGQRLSASGGILFDNVHVDERDVLGTHTDGSVRLSLAALGFQAALAQLLVGTAQGALHEAAEYTRNRARPWILSNVDKATDDPYIVGGYGELFAATEAAVLLADHASDALNAAARQSYLTADERARTASLVSAAKVLATKVVNETTARVFEFMGARATAGEFGFDRFWRNARTLTLHDPVSYKAREVGAYFLTGQHPPFTGYS